MPDVYKPGDPVMEQMAPAVQQALMVNLGRLDELTKRLDIALTTPPANSSPASTELADETKAYAYDLAAVNLRAAIDHLLTWRLLLQAGVMPTYAHMSLIRTAQESALLAYWLMEPGVASGTRHARGIAAQADDYEERRKFEESVGAKPPAPPSKAKLAKDRLAALMAKAAQLGMTKPNKNGDPALRITAPATVELFDLYVPTGTAAKGQAYYRLYSGYAHAKQWALALGVQQVSNSDASGRTLALSKGQDRMAVASTHIALDTLQDAVDAFEQLRR